MGLLGPPVSFCFFCSKKTEYKAGENTIPDVYIEYAKGEKISCWDLILLVSNISHLFAWLPLFFLLHYFDFFGLLPLCTFILTIVVIVAAVARRGVAVVPD